MFTKPNKQILLAIHILAAELSYKQIMSKEALNLTTTEERSVFSINDGSVGCLR